MGRKGKEIDKIILEMLTNVSKSGKELHDQVKTKIPEINKRNFDKNFNYALIKLLEKEKVKIVGYDSKYDPRSRSGKQAFSVYPVLFDSSERLTRPDINNKLDMMDYDNESYQMIRQLFKKRLDDLKNLEEERWNYLNAWIFSFTPEEIKNILREYYPDLEKYENILKNLKPEEHKSLISAYNKFILGERYDFYTKLYYGRDSDVNLDENEESVAKLFDDEIELGVLLNLLNSYIRFPNRKIWFYPVFPADFIDLWYPLPILPQAPLYGGQKTEITSDNRVVEKEHLLAIFLENYRVVDKKGKWNRDQALENGQFFLRYLRSDPNLDFEHMIDIISTYSIDDRNILNGLLAKGLSDESGSIKVFGDFYNEIYSIKYKTRIKTVLGILSQEKSE